MIDCRQGAVLFFSSKELCAMDGREKAVRHLHIVVKLDFVTWGLFAHF